MEIKLCLTVVAFFSLMEHARCGIKLAGTSYVESGATIDLNCTATDIDYRPKGVDWFKDGTRVKPGGRTLVTEYLMNETNVLHSRLEIERVSTNDAGTYVCRFSQRDVESIRVTVFSSKSKAREPDFCNRGDDIASKYSQCWAESLHAHRNPDLQKPQEVITAKFVENYATYMCSEVKPDALKCLRDEVNDCTNADKLMATADESGGTCVQNKLNPQFKLSIIDLLPAVRTDSPCMKIADNSTCYSDAVRKYSNVEWDIKTFYYRADKIFRETWECQIKLFKSNLHVCKNWQIPMLLSLQQDVMPSLFGLKLTPEQVDMLELKNTFSNPKTSTPSSTDCEGESQNKFYLLLRVLTQKPETVEGDIVFRVNVETAPEEVKNSFKSPGTDSRNKAAPYKKPKNKKQTQKTQTVA